MVQISVGEVHQVKLGPKASDPVLTCTVVLVKEGDAPKYLIDIDVPSGGMFGLASLSNRTDWLQCLMAIPYHTASQKQRVAKKLGF